MSKRKLCEACGSSNLFQGMDGEVIFTKCNRCCHQVWRRRFLEPNSSAETQHESDRSPVSHQTEPEANLAKLPPES